MFAQCGEAAEAWTMEELVRVANLVNGGKPQQGVKTQPWWPFIPLSHYMIPLLHVLIGIGNDLLESFRDWVNDEIESLDQQEVRTRRAVRTAEHKIIDYIGERDEWDKCNKGTKLSSLKSRIRYRKEKLVTLGAIVNVVNDANNGQTDSPVDVDDLLQEFEGFVNANTDMEEEDGPEFFVDEEGEEDEVIFVDEDDHNEESDNFAINIPDDIPQQTKDKIAAFQKEIDDFKKEMEPLAAERKEITDNLQRTREFLKELKKKLTSFRQVRKKSGEGLETKMFRVLKSIGVELTRYHGGSLNGKDIKKVMDNAAYIFDEFKLILKDGKREDSIEDEYIDRMCEKYKSVFLLWDGAFSLARKVDPKEADIVMYY